MESEIVKLESILKLNLPKCDSTKINLSDYKSDYRKTYFDHLPDAAVHEACMVFNEGEVLYKKYLEIIEGIEQEKNIEDMRLSVLVGEYLELNVNLMGDDDKEVVACIRSADRVEVAEKIEKFEVGKNTLHKHVYGAVSEYLINTLPNNDAIWLLYEWSLEKTKWSTVSAYFLEEFVNNDLPAKNFFRPGFELWLSGNSNNYWAMSNDLSKNRVVCKSGSKF